MMLYLLDVFPRNKVKLYPVPCHLKLEGAVASLLSESLMWDEFAISVGRKPASTEFCVAVLVNNPCPAEIKKTSTFPGVHWFLQNGNFD